MVLTTMQNRIIVLLLSSSVMLSLAAIGVAAAFSEDSVSEDFIKGNSSYNNSSISFIGQNIITSAPVDLSVGSGYYSSHPIAVGSKIGSRTELVNGDSATSMSHEVGFAEDISSRTEYAATSRSSQGEYENTNFATTKMQIDETVTNGKVDIGVLSGSDGPAWKNPAIEIEEEYIGTYHISKNFAINNSYSKKSFKDGWLNCCGGSYDIYPLKPVLLNADDVFNCRRCNSRSS
jgi:hypothetical protein